MAQSSVTLPMVCIAILAFLLALYPSSVPPFWFDEGWILSVAKNWAERGYYGELMNGRPKPAAMLNVGFPVVAPISGSFRLFGVGIWQGRLPAAVFTLSSFVLIYFLARRLYGPGVADATILVLLLMPGMSPILFGKQALGEMTAIFLYLCGLVCLVFLWRRTAINIVSVSLLWALASIAKLQIFPFLLIALMLTISTAAMHRQWRIVRRTAAMAAGLLLTFAFFFLLQKHLVGGARLLAEPGLYSGTAIIFTPDVRSVALLRTLILGSPVALGLLWNARWVFSCGNQPSPSDPGVYLGRLNLWSVAAGWLMWYVLLSISWDRYLFPPLFLGSVFVALSVVYLPGAGKDDSSDVLRNKRLKVKARSPQAVLFLAIIAFSVLANLFFLVRAFAIERDDSVLEAAAYLNNATPEEALIETYDLELTFLLNRRCHYPPDRVQLELNRKAFNREDVTIHYDPLEVNPDFLVVGPHSSLWGLYDSVLAQKQFELIKTYRRYRVYARIR